MPGVHAGGAWMEEREMTDWDDISEEQMRSTVVEALIDRRVEAAIAEAAS